MLIYVMVTAAVSSSLVPPLHLINLLFIQTSPVVSFHTCPPAVTIEGIASAHYVSFTCLLPKPASPPLRPASVYIWRTAISHFLPGCLSTHHLSAPGRMTVCLPFDYWISSGFVCLVVYSMSTVRANSLFYHLNTFLRHFFSFDPDLQFNKLCVTYCQLKTSVNFTIPIVHEFCILL